MSPEELQEAALRIAEFRTKICRHVVPCPRCYEKQVQLVDWVFPDGRGDWKCRICKFEWSSFHKEDGSVSMLDYNNDI